MKCTTSLVCFLIDNSHFEPFVHENYNRSSQDEPEPAPVTSEPAGPNMPPRSLSHISEASSHREPWAITQKYQSSHGPKSAGVSACEEGMSCCKCYIETEIQLQLFDIKFIHTVQPCLPSSGMQTVTGNDVNVIRTEYFARSF